MRRLSRPLLSAPGVLILFGAVLAADDTGAPALPEPPEPILAPEPLGATLRDAFSPANALPKVDLECESCDMPTGLHATINSRYGVFQMGDSPPRRIATWFGESFVAGSHTQAFTLEAGMGGILPVLGLQLLYDASVTPGVYGRQWAYEFRGLQSHFSHELAIATPIYRRNLTNVYEFGFGRRIDWFIHESFRQLGNGPLGEDDDYSILNQRIGTYFVQIDHTTPNCFERIRAEFTNDSGWTGGDNGDQFRTAAVRLRYLRQKGQLQVRAGLHLELFTGEVNTNFVDENGYYILDDLHFSDWSQGLFELELGLSWFMYCGPHLGEFGISIGLGPDTENIRDFFQNQLIHNRSSEVPSVPKLDRDDRLKSDITLFYILHFG